MCIGGRIPSHDFSNWLNCSSVWMRSWVLCECLGMQKMGISSLGYLMMGFPEGPGSRGFNRRSPSRNFDCAFDWNSPIDGAGLLFLLVCNAGFCEMGHAV